MIRTLILSLLLLAAARGAPADEAAPAPGTPAASAPATTQSVDAPKVDAPKQGAKRQTARTKAGGGKADPAAAAGQAAQPAGDVKMSGMSILGNEDTPKSLGLVPWKSAQLGDMPSLSRRLDTAAAPVDKDRVMRDLRDYAFKSGS